jgi:hypothetical protein
MIPHKDTSPQKQILFPDPPKENEIKGGRDKNKKWGRHYLEEGVYT